MTSAAAPAAGTVVSDTATCTGGKVVLGGGGSWSVTGGSANLLKVSPTDSLATSSTVWTFKVTVNTAFLLTDTVTVQAQAICGNS